MTRRPLFALALFALSVGSLFVGCAPAHPAPGNSAPVESAPAEDSPGWDCATQGNAVCGPLTAILSASGAASVSDRSGLFATFGADTVTYSADPEYVRRLPTCEPHPEGDLGLTVLTGSPRDVVESATRVAVVAHDGTCLVALGVAVLY